MNNNLNSSKQTLKVLASLVWYSGVFVLYFKSFNLLTVAVGLNANQQNILLAVVLGLVIGIIKTKYLFRRLCIKNLKRIDALVEPKLWQFYRPQFFIFLFSMILLGSYLSRVAHDNYMILITLSIIEISIATALLGSSNLYWKDWMKISKAKI